MERICLFPGTFDPVTLAIPILSTGHCHYLTNWLLVLAETAIKQRCFLKNKGLQWLREIYKNEPKITGVGL